MLEADWKYVDGKTKNGKVRQMKMGFKLEEKEIKKYSENVDEFSDSFAWSYDELRGILREMVEHHSFDSRVLDPLDQRKK